MNQKEQIKLKKSKKIQYIVNNIGHIWEWNFKEGSVRWVAEVDPHISYWELRKVDALYVNNLIDHFENRGCIITKMDENHFMVKRLFVIEEEDDHEQDKKYMLKDLKDIDLYDELSKVK